MNAMIDFVHHLDHFVLTTSDLVRCVDFYTRVLGMTFERFGDDRIALKFGAQKINVHEPGRLFLPRADVPTPGSLDLCFISAIPLDAVILHFQEQGVIIEEGPVPRTGAMYALRSIYLRDPDGNLIEISERAEAGSAVEGRESTASDHDTA